MTVTDRTQVGIVGAGPAILILSHLLALAGVDSVVVETRSRAYCEARQGAGMLESTTVGLLRDTGLSGRLDEECLEHDGIYLQFADERHHRNFRELTGGRRVAIYAQTEIVKDVIAARIADGAAPEFGVSDTVRDGDPELANAYSDHCLARVWRATHPACWMTAMLHADPGRDPFEAQLQIAQLRNLVTSRAAATMLADNYTGYAPLR